MRPRGFAAPAAPLLAGTVVTMITMMTGCAVRDRPYRFASPMLGSASVPPAPLPGAPPRPGATSDGSRAERVAGAPVHHATGLRITTPSGGASESHACIASGAGKTLSCAASAEAALAIASSPRATEAVRATLPAPHALPTTAPLPAVRSPDDMRALVGRRDPRDPIAAALGWARELGAPLEAQTSADLVAWADRSGRLADPTVEARPGDLLVFDRVTSDAEADLVAVVVGRDSRGVTELVYVGGGVIRRGFVDASRPALRRDRDGRTVNTFMRHGKRWPTKGSHYLAGELLAHVVHAR